MTHDATKLRALIAGIISGATGFVCYVASATPEIQSGLLSALVELIPLAWRPSVATITKAIAQVSFVYAIWRASQSGHPAPYTPATIGTLVIDPQTASAISAARNTIRDTITTRPDSPVATFSGNSGVNTAPTPPTTRLP